MNKSDKITGIVFFIFLLSSILYGLYYTNPIRTTWFKGVGKVISIFIMKPPSRKIEYYVNDIRYETNVDIGFLGNCVGDVHEILINPKDYNEVRLLEECPLFLKDELVGETIGIIDEDYKSDFTKEYQGAYPKFMNYDSGYNEIFPEYNYKVNDKVYSRLQKFVTPLDSPLVLKKGMKFIVRYWLDDPKRSILDYNEKR